jgi:ribonuclease HII
MSDTKPLPDFTLESRAYAGGAARVAGLDEAGRGPWAGPVVAACVILDPENIPNGLNDSKKLSAPQRAELHDALRACAEIGVGIADVGRIDKDNILQASLWAMAQATAQLATPPGHALVDGNKLPDLPCPAEAIVRGDGKSLSIAAASIIAKCVRDEIMIGLDERHPGFGWARNKGYGTAEHRVGLQNLGVSIHHRRSFAPVRAMLARN